MARPGAVGEATRLASTIVSAVRNDPLLAAAVVVGLVVLGSLGWVLLRRYLRTPGEEFAQVLASQDAVSVLMHPNPDPDAMSCALAVKRLATDADTDVTIYYSGEIRHHENRAFETVLDVEFDHVEHAHEVTDAPVVLVDHNEPRGMPGAEKITPIAVVDHHPGDGSGSEFTDVRPDVGACASIMAEYFEQLGWQPGDGEEDEETPAISADITTGLIYGIMSDTTNLTKGCSGLEFHAAAFLYPGVDEDKLDRIANPAIDEETLEVKARAFTERQVRNAFVVSDIGEVSNVDAVPQAADELLRLEGISAVVVLAEKDGTIHLKGRSRDDRIHMGNTLNAVVEDIPMGGAGGHPRMGGGQLSLEHMEGLGPGDGVGREQLHERLFDAMNGEI